MQILVCPHCRTDIDAKAFVCVGCGAEVVRGATQTEKSTVGCLFAVVGFVLTYAAMVMILPRLKPPKEYEPAFLVGLFVAAVIFNFLGRVLAKSLFRSRLRFFRTYKHR